jgi:hypothetical protein
MEIKRNNSKRFNACNAVRHCAAQVLLARLFVVPEELQFNSCREIRGTLLAFLPPIPLAAMALLQNRSQPREVFTPSSCL